jgi:hypothetical protein
VDSSLDSVVFLYDQSFKIWHILPKQQPEINSCSLHISSKWKEQIPEKGFALIEK